MKIYLKSVVKQLKNFSSTLDKTSLLVDKPWALIDDDLEMQKLIFKKNKELILSKNGVVQIGKWDYFPEAKSLLIDRNTDKILCNEAFIDKGVLVLRLDGTDSKFFILANENIVPDLDANRYLKNLRYQKLRIAETELIDGRILEVARKDEYLVIEVGNPVTVEADPIEDGKYQLADPKKYYQIKEGKIYKILTETSYSLSDKSVIIIHQRENLKIRNDDEVFMNGKKIDSGIINFSKSKNLIVRNGRVVRFERKNPVTRWLSKIFNQFGDNYYE